MKITKERLKQIILEEVDLYEASIPAEEKGVYAMTYIPIISWALNRAVDTGGVEELNKVATQIKSLYKDSSNRDEIYAYIESAVHVRTEKADEPHVEKTIKGWSRGGAKPWIEPKQRKAIEDMYTE